MRYNKSLSSAIAACGLIVAAQPAVAQSGRVNTPVGVVQIGLEGGASIATLRGDGIGDPENRTGYYGGLSFIVQPNSSAVGFQTGVLYAQRGAESTFNVSGVGQAVTGGVRLGYIEVPAMIRIGVPLSVAGIAPTIMAGGSVAWRINCRAVAQTGNLGGNSDCDNALLDQNLDVKRFDGGLTAGIEMPIKLGDHYLAVPSVRYIHGLTNISDAGSGNVKNRSILIGLGLRFR